MNHIQGEYGKEETTMKRFLHVGCGQSKQQHTTRGFADKSWQEVRFDIDESASPDITGDVLDLDMIESNSFDAIFSSHNIEHVYAYQVPLMLKGFLRVLNPNGYFVVTCPNLQAVAKLVARDQLTDVAYVSPAGPITPQDVIFGHSASLEKGNEYMAHKTGFTPKTLRSALTESGFGSVAILARERKLDIWAVATKKKIDSEKQLKEIAKLHFPTT